MKNAKGVVRFLRVLLVDVDSIWFNLALMKIAHYHKSKGNEVYLARLGGKWFNRFGKPTNLQIKAPSLRYDKVYISCIFTKNRSKALSIAKMSELLGIETEIGGSGVSLAKTLPNEIEHLMPDYDLYGLDYSVGFLTRGCIRNCPWCIVPEKEGSIRLHSPLREFLHPRHGKVMILDNNLLAHPKHKDLLIELIGKRLKVCFTQGLDIRLIGDENAKLLRLVRHRDTEFKKPRLYFSWDILNIEKQVMKGIEILKAHNIPTSRLLFYILCGFNIHKEAYTWSYFLEHDWYRYETLARLGCKPFIMKYNQRKDIPLLNVFARWTNYAHKTKKKSLGNLKSFKSFLKHENPKLAEWLEF